MRTRCQILFALALASTAGAQIHVDDDAAPGGNGVSWSTAYNSLDDALNVASAGDEVWVAEGTYVPTQARIAGDRRSVSFAPAPGVALHGGFAGFETSLAARAGQAFDTALEGTIGSLGDDTDNAYHVVYLGAGVARRTLDGFNIRRGYADGPGNEASGGGIYTRGANQLILNCILEDNYALNRGGALGVQGIPDEVLINGCTFRWNEAGSHGGAIVSTRSFFVTNTEFYRNRAGILGGAVFALGGRRNPVGALVSRYQNCVFQTNSAANGGAVFLRRRFPLLTGGMIEFGGCTFTGNIGIQDGAAIGMPTVVLGGTGSCLVDMHNSIIWGNFTRGTSMLSGAPDYYRNVDYSIVEGGWPGMGNLDQDPLFAHVAGFNLRLQPGSPAIDSGNNDLILVDDQDMNGNGSVIDPTPFDFDGTDRRKDDPSTPDTGVGASPVVDMGAFEF